jgi:HPt (histidine-containing phosphotransfer) domain-containing protein
MRIRLQEAFAAGEAEAVARAAHALKGASANVSGERAAAAARRLEARARAGALPDEAAHAALSAELDELERALRALGDAR